MKQNTLILAGAALLLFLLMKKKGAAKMPANVTAPMAALPNIQEVRSQTVNFDQLAPSPSMVMDMPGSSYRAGRPYGCECNGSKLGDMPFVC